MIRGWAPSPGAAILSPEMVVFRCQIGADTLSPDVCRLGVVGPLDARGGAPGCDRGVEARFCPCHLSPPAWAGPARRLLCVPGVPIRGAASGLQHPRAAGEVARVLYPVRSPPQATPVRSRLPHASGSRATACQAFTSWGRGPLLHDSGVGGKR